LVRINRGIKSQYRRNNTNLDPQRPFQLQANKRQIHLPRWPSQETPRDSKSNPFRPKNNLSHQIIRSNLQTTLNRLKRRLRRLTRARAKCPPVRRSVSYRTNTGLTLVRIFRFINTCSVSSRWPSGTRIGCKLSSARSVARWRWLWDRLSARDRVSTHLVR